MNIQNKYLLHIGDTFNIIPGNDFEPVSKFVVIRLHGDIVTAIPYVRQHPNIHQIAIELIDEKSIVPIEMRG